MEKVMWKYEFSVVDVNKGSVKDLGTYVGDDLQEACSKVAKDHGFDTFQDLVNHMVEVHGVQPMIWSQAAK